MVLKNTENGEPFVVNMEKPPTYDNLDQYGKRKVEETSRWKDGEIVSDRSYAKLRRVQDEFKTSSRRVQDEFKMYPLPHTSSPLKRRQLRRLGMQLW